MQASVTDRYATELAGALYAELALAPAQPVAAALAAARYAVEEQRRCALPAAASAGQQSPPPEYAVPTVFAAGDDLPLVDPALPALPLARPQTVPVGGVRDLPLGRLIGRRRELRTATAVLRRTPAAVEKYGAAAGVLLAGIGGIGKPALAGRVMSRLRGDGWAGAVHEGIWDPTRLLSAV